MPEMPWKSLPPIEENHHRIPGCSACLIPLEPEGYDGELGCTNNFRGNKHGRWHQVELLVLVTGYREYV